MEEDIQNSNNIIKGDNQNYYLSEPMGPNGVLLTNNPALYKKPREIPVYQGPYRGTGQFNVSGNTRSSSIGQDFDFFDDSYDSTIGDYKMLGGGSLDQHRYALMDGWDIFGRAAAGFGATAAASFIGATVGTVWGLLSATAQAVAKGSISEFATDFSESSINKLTTEASNYVTQKGMRIYKPDDYLSGSLWDRMGRGVFWAEALSNAGYTVGTMAAAAVGGGMLGAALGRAGAALGAASRLGKAANAVSRFATSGITQSVAASMGEAAMETLNNKTENVQRKNFQAFETFHENAKTMSFDEAQNKYNKDLNDIERDENLIGNSVFIGNMLVLSASNATQYAKFLGRSASRIKNAVVNKSGAKSVALTANEKLAASQKKAYELAVKDSDIHLDSRGLYERANRTARSKAKATALTIGARTLFPLSEGGEEVMQSALTNMQYYSADWHTYDGVYKDPRYKFKTARRVNDEINMITRWGDAIKGVAAHWGDIGNNVDTLTEFAMGYLTGLVFGAATNSREYFKKRTEEINRDNMIDYYMDLINKRIKEMPSIDQNFKNFFRQAALEQGKLAGDQFSLNNAETQQVISDIEALSMIGQQSRYLEQAEGARDEAVGILEKMKQQYAPESGTESTTTDGLQSTLDQDGTVTTDGTELSGGTELSEGQTQGDLQQEGAGQQTGQQTGQTGPAVSQTVEMTEEEKAILENVKLILRENGFADPENLMKSPEVFDSMIESAHKRFDNNRKIFDEYLKAWWEAKTFGLNVSNTLASKYAYESAMLSTLKGRAVDMANLLSTYLKAAAGVETLTQPKQQVKKSWYKRLLGRSEKAEDGQEENVKPVSPIDSGNLAGVNWEKIDARSGVEALLKAENSEAKDVIEELYKRLMFKKNKIANYESFLKDKNNADKVAEILNAIKNSGLDHFQMLEKIAEEMTALDIIEFMTAGTYESTNTKGIKKSFSRDSFTRFLSNIALNNQAKMEENQNASVADMLYGGAWMLADGSKTRENDIARALGLASEFTEEHAKTYALLITAQADPKTEEKQDNEEDEDQPVDVNGPKNDPNGPKNDPNNPDGPKNDPKNDPEVEEKKKKNIIRLRTIAKRLFFFRNFFNDTLDKYAPEFSKFYELLKTFMNVGATEQERLEAFTQMTDIMGILLLGLKVYTTNSSGSNFYPTVSLLNKVLTGILSKYILVCKHQGVDSGLYDGLTAESREGKDTTAEMIKRVTDAVESITAGLEASVDKESLFLALLTQKESLDKPLDILHSVFNSLTETDNAQVNFYRSLIRCIIGSIITGSFVMRNKIGPIVQTTVIQTVNDRTTNTTLGPTFTKLCEAMSDNLNIPPHLAVHLFNYLTSNDVTGTSTKQNLLNFYASAILADAKKKQQNKNLEEALDEVINILVESGQIKNLTGDYIKEIKAEALKRVDLLLDKKQPEPKPEPKSEPKPDPKPNDNTDDSTDDSTDNADTTDPEQVAAKAHSDLEAALGDMTDPNLVSQGMTAARNMWQLQDKQHTLSEKQEGALNNFIAELKKKIDAQDSSLSSIENEVKSFLEESNDRSEPKPLPEPLSDPNKVDGEQPADNTNQNQDDNSDGNNDNDSNDGSNDGSDGSDGSSDGNNDDDTSNDLFDQLDELFEDDSNSADIDTAINDTLVQKDSNAEEKSSGSSGSFQGSTPLTLGSNNFLSDHSKEPGAIRSTLYDGQSQSRPEYAPHDHLSKIFSDYRINNSLKFTNVAGSPVYIATINFEGQTFYVGCAYDGNQLFPVSILSIKDYKKLAGTLETSDLSFDSNVNSNLLVTGVQKLRNYKFSQEKVGFSRESKKDGGKVANIPGTLDVSFTAVGLQDGTVVHVGETLNDGNFNNRGVVMTVRPTGNYSAESRSMYVGLPRTVSELNDRFKRLYQVELLKALRILLINNNSDGAAAANEKLDAIQKLLVTADLTNQDAVEKLQNLFREVDDIYKAHRDLFIEDELVQISSKDTEKGLKFGFTKAIAISNTIFGASDNKVFKFTWVGHEYSENSKKKEKRDRFEVNLTYTDKNGVQLVRRINFGLVKYNPLVAKQQNKIDRTVSDIHRDLFFSLFFKPSAGYNRHVSQNSSVEEKAYPLTEFDMSAFEAFADSFCIKYNIDLLGNLTNDLARDTAMTFAHYNKGNMLELTGRYFDIEPGTTKNEEGKNSPGTVELQGTNTGLTGELITTLTIDDLDIPLSIGSNGSQRIDSKARKTFVQRLVSKLRSLGANVVTLPQDQMRNAALGITNKDLYLVLEAFLDELGNAEGDTKYLAEFVEAFIKKKLKSTFASALMQKAMQSYNGDFREALITAARLRQQQVNGFVKDGVIYISEEASTATSMHEFTHLWDKVILRANPKFYEKMVQDLLHTKKAKELMKNPYYKTIPRNEFASEVHAALVKDFMDDVADKAAKNLITRIWNFIKELFNIKSADKVDTYLLSMPIESVLQSESLEELGQRVAKRTVLDIVIKNRKKQATIIAQAFELLGEKVPDSVSREATTLNLGDVIYRRQYLGESAHTTLSSIMPFERMTRVATLAKVIPSLKGLARTAAFSEMLSLLPQSKIQELLKELDEPQEGSPRFNTLEDLMEYAYDTRHMGNNTLSEGLAKAMHDLRFGTLRGLENARTFNSESLQEDYKFVSSFNLIISNMKGIGIEGYMSYTKDGILPVLIFSDSLSEQDVLKAINDINQQLYDQGVNRTVSAYTNMLSAGMGKSKITLKINGKTPIIYEAKSDLSAELTKNLEAMGFTEEWYINQPKEVQDNIKLCL